MQIMQQYQLAASACPRSLQSVGMASFHQEQGRKNHLAELVSVVMPRPGVSASVGAELPSTLVDGRQSTSLSSVIGNY